MLKKSDTLNAGPKKYFWSTVLAAAMASTPLLVGSAAWADEGKNDRAVRLLATIPVPVSPDNTTAGALYSFDISWVDQTTETYYLADRSNKRVDILDAHNLGTVTQINATPSFRGFTGSNNTSGPNGVATSGHCLFVTDAPSRVVSFDTTSFPPTQISDVHTATLTPNRADELAVDPTDSLIFAINNADNPPFGSFIRFNNTTCALTQPTAANKLTIDAAHGVNATDGAEQPVWEPVTRRFYLSIPEIAGVASHGAVVRIVPNATSVSPSDVFEVDFCSPAGLTVGPKHGQNVDLFIGCNKVFDTAGHVWDPNGTVTAAPKDVIIDARDGTIDANVLGVGAGDEVWFNKGDGNYYATGSGSPFRPIDTMGANDAKGSTPLGVVDAKDGTLLQQVPTYNVPAGTGHPSGTAHSVAANAANNLIFVPLGANNAFSAFARPGGGPVPDCEHGCIAVFGHPDED